MREINKAKMNEHDDILFIADMAITTLKYRIHAKEKKDQIKNRVKATLDGDNCTIIVMKNDENVLKWIKM
jgi:hypothetical protein